MRIELKPCARTYSRLVDCNVQNDEVGAEGDDDEAEEEGNQEDEENLKLDESRKLKRTRRMRRRMRKTRVGGGK